MTPTAMYPTQLNLMATIAVSWARALRDRGVDQDKRCDDQPGADEIVETMQSMLSLLHHIHDFAELEAGISCVVPERLQIEEIVRGACANAEISAGISGANKIAWNLAPEELPLLGDRDKLIQAFSNIFKFATHNIQYNDEILVTIERLSKLEMAVIIRYPCQEISECEIKRLLSSNNLVEHMIALGADNIQLAMPMAKGLVELHSGTLAIENKAGEEVEISVTLPVGTITTTEFLCQ